MGELPIGIMPAAGRRSADQWSACVSMPGLRQSRAALVRRHAQMLSLGTIALPP